MKPSSTSFKKHKHEESKFISVMKKHKHEESKFISVMKFISNIHIIFLLINVLYSTVILKKETYVIIKWQHNAEILAHVTSVHEKIRLFLI